MKQQLLKAVCLTSFLSISLGHLFAQTEKKIDHDFRKGNLYNWQVDPSQSYSSLAIYTGDPVRLRITAGQANANENTNYRSDIRVTPTADPNPEITIYKQYPIFAIKWKRPVQRSVTYDNTSLGTATSNPGITFDTSVGDYKRASNNDTRLTVGDYTVSYWNMATGFLRSNGSNNVYALTGNTASLPATSTGAIHIIQDSIQLNRITIKIADIKMSATDRANGMNLIDVLWIKTFASVAELETYIADNEPLPVVLTDYYLKMLQNGRVAVNWKVASEQNNDYFLVERKGLDGSFDEVAKVRSKGAGESAYSFIDENPLTGENYYRLSQVDLDGTKKELDIKSIKISLDIEKRLSVYPHPVTGNSFMVSHAAGKENTQVKIFDLTGNSVFQGSLPAVSQGLYDVKLTQKPQPGMYILTVDNTVSKKILIK